MHGKPTGYYEMYIVDMEETIRIWFENKIDDLEVVENLKKHVRTFAGIFRLSRQDLIQDIKEEPQYPLEDKRCLDGQPSLVDLRKHVFAFEFMKLTGVEKQEADLTVEGLFEDCDLLKLTENDKEEKENSSQSQPMNQSVASREPVSRSELEISYTSAFPALPPSKGNRPKVPEPIPSFWQQRSPLRSNPSVHPSKSKTSVQDGSSEKAPTPLNKRIRTGGKENEYGTASVELKKRVGKNRDQRNRREDLFSTNQIAPKSPDYLSVLSDSIKSMLGMVPFNHESYVVSRSKKKEAEKQTKPESNTQEIKGFNLNSVFVQEQSAQVPENKVVFSWWPISTASLENFQELDLRNFRSEPQGADEEPRVASKPLNQKLSSISSEECTSSPPSQAEADHALKVDNPYLVALQPADESALDQSLDEDLFLFEVSNAHTSLSGNAESPSVSNRTGLWGWPFPETDTPLSESVDPDPTDLLSQLREESVELPTRISFNTDSHHSAEDADNFSYVEAAVGPKKMDSFSLIDLHKDDMLWYSAEYLNQRSQQSLKTADAMEKHNQGASGDVTSGSLIDRPIDQVFTSIVDEQSVSQFALSVDLCLKGSQGFHQDFSFKSDIDLQDHLLSKEESFFGKANDVQENTQQYSLFGNTSGQASLNKYPQSSDENQWFQYQIFLHSDRLQRDLFPESFSRIPSFQTASSDGEFELLFNGDSEFSSQFTPVKCDDWITDHQMLDPLGIGALASRAELNLEDEWNECSWESPQLSHSEHSSLVLSSFYVRTPQDICTCEGACNCASMSSRRPDQSAFTSMNGDPMLPRPGPIGYYPYDNLLFPRTAPTCSVERASHHQREKMKKSHLEIIKPEEEESHLPWGELSYEKKVPDFLLKESMGTQTEDCDEELGISFSPDSLACQSSKKEYEEKHWKDLMPLSEEDVQRDLLYFRMQAQREGTLQYGLLDVVAMEGYEFADFQLLSEASASLHFPQNRAVYVKDLEKAWLSESYRRLGKSKGRRPLHPNKPCTFYLEGCCYRSDCKFSHDINTITCHFWEMGQCFKGDLCPFLHGYSRGFSGSDGGEEFDITKADFPELTRKDMRLNSAPAPKKRRNKKNSVHRLQLPRGT